MLEKKIRELSNKTSRRIALPTICTILLFVTAIFFVLLPQLEESFQERKKEMIRELTETTWSLIGTYHERELSGELSREEAQKRRSCVFAAFAMDRRKKITSGSTTWFRG